jgi:nicotinate phosphoribosyltransferase
MQGDVVTTADKPEPGVPLLSPIMRDGRRVGSTTTLTEARERAARALATLPDTLCGLGPAGASYPVEISSAIMQLALEADRLIAAASS